jgi:hypothetical protein
VERVRAWEVAGTFERHDQGWSADELATEVPRLFGAGTKRSDPPPPEWQEQYRRRKQAGADKGGSP